MVSNSFGNFDSYSTASRVRSNNETSNGLSCECDARCDAAVSAVLLPELRGPVTSAADPSFSSASASFAAALASSISRSNAALAAFAFARLFASVLASLIFLLAVAFLVWISSNNLRFFEFSASTSAAVPKNWPTGFLAPFPVESVSSSASSSFSLSSLSLLLGSLSSAPPFGVTVGSLEDEEEDDAADDAAPADAVGLEPSPDLLRLFPLLVDIVMLVCVSC